MTIQRDALDKAIDALGAAAESGRLTPAASRAVGEVLRELHAARDELGRQGFSPEGRRHLAVATRALGGDDIPAELRELTAEHLAPALGAAGARFRRRHRPPGGRHRPSRGPGRARGRGDALPACQEGRLAIEVTKAGRFGRNTEIRVVGLDIESAARLLEVLK